MLCIFISMKFVLTEEEKERIKGLYKQNEPEPPKRKVVKLDNTSLRLLPNEYTKEVTSTILNNQELINKLNTKFDTNITKDPLNFLISKGITPYLFVVPDYTSGGFLTTGLSIKIDGTPFTMSLNLGTDPTKVLNSLKFSQVKISLPINK